MSESDFINKPEYLQGYIADNQDEENFGRVKVHIYGKTEGIAVEDLPYANVLHPLSTNLPVSDTTSEIGTEVLLLKLNKSYNSLIVLGQFKKRSQTF